jgi:hypothetical protein
MSTINGSTKTGKFLFCSRQLAVGEVGRVKVLSSAEEVTSRIVIRRSRTERSTTSSSGADYAQAVPFPREHYGITAFAWLEYALCWPALVVALTT